MGSVETRGCLTAQSSQYGAVSVTVFSMGSVRQPRDSAKGAASAAEEVRALRLREDSRRPLSVNLAETIALSHTLLQVAGVAGHRD